MRQEKIDEKIDSEKIISRFRQAFGFEMDKEVAEALGISAQDFFHRKKRGSLLPLMIQYSVDTTVNLHWLIRGEGSAHTTSRQILEEAALQTKCLDAEEYRLVPLLQSWVKGGPEGRLIYEGIADHYPFKKYFIERLVGSNPARHKELFLARVKGDSMAPTINDGEIIMFDTNEVERFKIRTGQIYLVQLPEGTVSVKRLSLSVDPQGARLICHSDNLGAYKMFDFSLAPGRPIHSYVLGRVRWAGKEFD